VFEEEVQEKLLDETMINWGNPKITQTTKTRISRRDSKAIGSKKNQQLRSEWNNLDRLELL
jgi:hypothetical protein